MQLAMGMSKSKSMVVLGWHGGGPGGVVHGAEDGGPGSVWSVSRIGVRRNMSPVKSEPGPFPQPAIAPVTHLTSVVFTWTVMSTLGVVGLITMYLAKPDALPVFPVWSQSDSGELGMQFGMVAGG
jgi:hypothetical protein